MRLISALCCLGCFSSKPTQNRHPERSASQIYRVNRARLARSRRTPKMLTLTMPFAPFQPPKPALGGSATVFARGPRTRTGSILRCPAARSTDLGMESSQEHLPTSIAEVLRLRAIKPSVCNRAAKRFAQDDDFVGALKKNIPKIGRKLTRLKPSPSPSVFRSPFSWSGCCGPE